MISHGNRSHLRHHLLQTGARVESGAASGPGPGSYNVQGIWAGGTTDCMKSGAKGAHSSAAFRTVSRPEPYGHLPDSPPPNQYQQVGTMPGLLYMHGLPLDA